MNRFRWPLLILVVCLPLILLAAGFQLPGLSPSEIAVPAPVPAGDFELAWFNTTTGGAAWERFVTGVRHTDLPDLSVDDSRAFPGQAGVPEVAVSFKAHTAKLRIRWYKLSGEHPPNYWMAKLAARNPAPLAIIGGGSSDRARDLALALANQEHWHGDKPAFFITNATAESVHLPDRGGMTKLLDIYPGHSFRVCFNNRQMAEAMLDFVWQNPDLRPRNVTGEPKIFRISWDDDPFSGDLLEQFSEALPTVLARHRHGEKPEVVTATVPFSVGSFSQPNRAEAEAVEQIVKEIALVPDQRALLVLPTVPAPARRLLRKLCESDPTIASRIVAINGDGMGANTILRDGNYLWPVSSLPVPLLLFAHANPMAYDDVLKPPSATDDVLHTAELIRIIATTVYDPSTLTGADELIERLRSAEPRFFGNSGNRRGGTGEFLLLLKPTPQGDADAIVDVWMRHRDRTWSLSKTEPLRQGAR